MYSYYFFLRWLFYTEPCLARAAGPMGRWAGAPGRYYETRGRRYLWDKYQKFDAEYVKLDKKLQAKEWKEMWIIEKGFRDKKEIIQQARMDYRMGRKGKAFEELNI